MLYTKGHSLWLYISVARYYFLMHACGTDWYPGRQVYGSSAIPKKQGPHIWPVFFAFYCSNMISWRQPIIASGREDNYFIGHTFKWTNGTRPSVYISHNVTPKLQTSDFSLYTRLNIVSGDIHLMGSASVKNMEGK